LGVVPNEQDVVHNGHEVLNDFGDFFVLVSKRQEERLEGLEVLGVLVGLSSSNLNILLKLAERSSHGGLVLFKELEHLLDALLVKLLTDGVEVGGLVLPEGELSERIGVVTVLQRGLRVLLEHILDLLGPVNDSSLEVMGFVLAGGLFRLRVAWRHGKVSATLNLSNSHDRVSQEDLKLIDEILGNKIRPANLVERVVEDRHVHLGAHLVQVLQNRLVDLHEDHLLFHGLDAKFLLIFLVVVRASHNKQDLSLDVLLVRYFSGELNALRADRDGKEELSAGDKFLQGRLIIIVLLNLFNGIILNLTHVKIDERVFNEVFVLSELRGLFNHQ